MIAATSTQQQPTMPTQAMHHWQHRHYIHLHIHQQQQHQMQPQASSTSDVHHNKPTRRTRVEESRSVSGLPPQVMMMHEPAATHTDPELVDKVRVMMQKQAKYHADKVKNGQQKQQSSDMPMPSFNAQRSISISTMRSFWLTWMGSMVDTLKLQPQLVSVAAHFMDVAVGCTAEWNAHDISDLQHRYAVMAVTSFITAIKLHQPQRILICSITRFSPVPVTDAEVVQMEVRLYEMMDYRLHPPTAEEFAELFVGFLPQSSQSSQQRRQQ
mmetsp:Transcript_12433/g.36100  ORF Transcript_12433/g.36100 Transcript_12433/m.36100 type:complete len:269 (+) Transcript_12433:99-905(+)